MFDTHSLELITRIEGKSVKIAKQCSSAFDTSRKMCVEKLFDFFHLCLETLLHNRILCPKLHWQSNWIYALHDQMKLSFLGEPKNAWPQANHISKISENICTKLDHVYNRKNFHTGFFTASHLLWLFLAFSSQHSVIVDDIKWKIRAIWELFYIQLLCFTFTSHTEWWNTYDSFYFFILKENYLKRRGLEWNTWDTLTMKVSKCNKWHGFS